MTDKDEDEARTLTVETHTGDVHEYRDAAKYTRVHRDTDPSLLRITDPEGEELRVYNLEYVANYGWKDTDDLRLQKAKNRLYDRR